MQSLNLRHIAFLIESGAREMVMGIAPRSCVLANTL